MRYSSGSLITIPSRLCAIPLAAGELTERIIKNNDKSDFLNKI
jgi:hypothetical protein